MEKKMIAKEMYYKIIVELKKKKIKQKDLAIKIGISKQAFSDNIIKLNEGKFPKIEFLLDIQKNLEVDLGFKF